MKAVFEDLSRLGERYRLSRKNLLKGLILEVSRLLRKEYMLDLNTANKILKSYFADDFLPSWYFYSNSAEDIAAHILIITQMMAPEVEYLEQVSEDGKAITYILNVGKDYPGKLARIIGENLEFGIIAYDSVKTLSGVRIITLENSSMRNLRISEQEQHEIDQLRGTVRREHRGKHTEEFLKCLPLNYLYEECKSFSPSERILRHLRICEEVLESNKLITGIEDTVGETDDEKLDRNEKRVFLGAKNPGKHFILRVLKVFEERGINLNRSYCNTFEQKDNKVVIMTIYTKEDEDLSGVESVLQKIKFHPEEHEEEKVDLLGVQLEIIVRKLSSPLTAPELEGTIKDLKRLIAVNTDPANPEEMDNFLLNAFSDFMRTAAFIGIEDNYPLLKSLLGFDSFDEYYVAGKYLDKKFNVPGFRVKHNAVRGIAYKGGLRIDPIVNFVEVAALAFMMTWKCARTKILFGGAKGGLILDKVQLSRSKMDYFDTLANYGSALFLVTGPSEDVPAGDVGCGPSEIGHMFEGFKTALRELAMVSSGIKQGVARIGNKIVSVERANTMLRDHFDIDYLDEEVLRKLVTSEEYLELVAAPQITGKPKMGIEARTGATGRGLCYTILAVVTKLYLDDEWEPAESLSEGEISRLRTVAGITEKTFLEREGQDIISDRDWEKLDAVVYGKLLKNKKVVVQGSGKVGSSIMRELARYGVNMIAVADAGGAVIGDHLDVDDLLNSVKTSDECSVVHAGKNITRRIDGAREGAAVLELPCDILVPAALENAITAENAGNVEARIIACGSNGTNSSKAEFLLSNEKKETTVIYDFLANSGGVTASYFEWLRNLYQRYRYEAEVINKERFDIDIMNSYIMPEFRMRIKEILLQDESEETTARWNKLLRDILICAVNEDYDFAKANDISMRIAGFANAQLRVLAALLLGLSDHDRSTYWREFSDRLKELLRPFLLHPESALFSERRDAIIKELYGEG